MARFTTRVVLHGVKENDSDTYSKLHEAMAKVKQIRYIYDTKDKKWYELPPAEYNCVADKTVKQISNEAHEAAKTVWKGEISILVTQGVRTWYNLAPAK